MAKVLLTPPSSPAPLLPPLSLGQHVLSRSSILVDPSDGSIEARFTVALPARGRSIEGTWAARILLERLPALLHKALLFASLDAARLRWGGGLIAADFHGGGILAHLLE